MVEQHPLKMSVEGSSPSALTYITSFQTHNRMSGRNRFEAHRGEMKSHAGLLQTASTALDQVSHQIHYILRTNASEREHAITQADAYKAEILKFLSEMSLSRMQGILQLSNPQVAITEFLLERHKRNKLPLIDTQGRIGQTGIPYLVKRYESVLGQEKPINLQSFLDESTRSKSATLTVRWSTKPTQAHGFHIFGQVGSPISRMQDFVTLPAKANEPSEVQTLMGLAPNAYGMMQNIQVFDGGDRFVIEKFPKNSRDVARTGEYVLLEKFRGNHTKQDHWIYGLKQ